MRGKSGKKYQAAEPRRIRQVNPQAAGLVARKENALIQQRVLSMAAEMEHMAKFADDISARFESPNLKRALEQLGAIAQVLRKELE